MASGKQQEALSREEEGPICSLRSAARREDGREHPGGGGRKSWGCPTLQGIPPPGWENGFDRGAERTAAALPRRKELLAVAMGGQWEQRGSRVQQLGGLRREA